MMSMFVCLPDKISPEGKGQFWEFSSPKTTHCNAFAANNDMGVDVHSAGEV